MTTLTINVDSGVEKEFRKHAAAVHKHSKGYLGKTVTEAMGLWLKQVKQKDISKRQQILLDDGFNLGAKNYSTRDELYDR